jgi:RimJ/RimL family protein N-acetyltransferase
MANRSLSNLGECARLLLRTPQEKDMESIAALWTSPEAMQYLGGPREPEVVLEHFHEYARDPEAFVRNGREWWWSMVELSSGEFVGLNSLIEKDVDDETGIDLGYYLLPSYWGLGYATEASERVIEYAFGELELESLISIIDPRNSASISVARKLGLAFERKALRSDGLVRHVYRYWRTDWLQDVA